MLCYTVLYHQFTAAARPGTLAGANILETPRSEVVIDPRCATVGAK